MASITIKNIPDDLLDRARTLADIERRSLNKELISLIEAGLAGRVAIDVEPTSLADLARRQAESWRALTGRWDSDDGASIMDARTTGREVDL